MRFAAVRSVALRNKRIRDEEKQKEQHKQSRQITITPPGISPCATPCQVRKWSLHSHNIIPQELYDEIKIIEREIITEDIINEILEVKMLKKVE